MKVLIVEDDVSIALSYEILLNEIGDFEITAVDNWIDARKILKKQIPHFAIVDIYLHEENSSGYFQYLDELCIPYIVCTGYPENSTIQKALSQNAQAYMTKPIDKTVFSYAVQKIVKSIEKSIENKDFVILEENRNIHRIPIGSVHLIEVDGNYVTVTLESSKKIILKTSLHRISKQLNTDYFLRLNRGTIVNKNIIKSYQKTRVFINDGRELTVGKKYKNEVINDLKNY